MAKDPAFLFYSQDFIVGALSMTFEDRGKYITILSLMHQQGRMSEETISFLVGSVSVNLKSKFQVDEEGLWYNLRLEEEVQKRAKFVDSRRENGRKGGRPGKPLAKPNGKAKNNLPENEIEDENNKVKRVNNIEERIELFKNSILPFRDKYPADMLKDFFEYWTEQNHSKTKFRAEKESTWDIDKRLARWASNNKSFSKPTNSRALPPGMA